MTNTEVLIINHLLEEIVMDYPEFCIPENYLERFTYRQQEQFIKDCKINMIKAGIPKGEIKKYNYWNLWDAERVDLIRKKLLKENNIRFIEN